MSLALIDYGCHSFSYRLASTLWKRGLPISYVANGSLESPNLSSLSSWARNSPELVRTISCQNPYGKISLRGRMKGEFEWGSRCVAALEEMRPTAIVVNCVPLTPVTAIHRWALKRKVPFVYWFQDIQSRAIHDLLGRKLGLPGRTLGAFAHLWEQNILEHSDMVITIAPGHEKELPLPIRRSGRHALLENWANVEEFPQFPVANDWSRRNGLDKTTNIMYSGTLGLKHDLDSFIALAKRFQSRPDVRIVIVSSDQAAQKVRLKAESLGLSNLIVLPFQPYSEVPQVLASASVLIAPLEISAGSFCVPSKILSYLCAGRPTVIAINHTNAAAQTIRNAGAGFVVPPGDPQAFIAAVETFLDDHALRISTGASARSYAESTFGIDNIMHRFVSIINRVAPTLTLTPKTQSAKAS
jgi:glycosyltransferase involved in cell wall biosynthesis